MTSDDIKKELIEQGLNPEDYSILLEKNGYQIWKKEVAPNYARFATQEDKPIKLDINDVAEFTTVIATDKDEIAEMLVYALQKIQELEGKLNG